MLRDLPIVLSTSKPKPFSDEPALCISPSCLPSSACPRAIQLSISFTQNHRKIHQKWLSPSSYKTECSDNLKDTREIHRYLVSSRWTHFDELHNNERPSWMWRQSPHLHQPIIFSSFSHFIIALTGFIELQKISFRWVKACLLSVASEHEKCLSHTWHSNRPLQPQT